MVGLAVDGGPPTLLLYASRMFKLHLQFIILLPVFLLLDLQTASDVQVRERPLVVAGAEAAVSDADDPLLCTELQITNVGVVCNSRFGLQAQLDFPEVDLKRALAGSEYLPQVRAEFTAHEKTVGDKDYRNIAFVLRWEPATPEFLQIYLNEYMPYWGNRVPYRLFWNIRYEECSLENCTVWVTVDAEGEFLPTDINDLQSDLAADVNFNGVPAAFWNGNVTP